MSEFWDETDPSHRPRGPEHHEMMGRLHLDLARTIRERDALNDECFRLRREWDGAVALLAKLADRLEEVEAGDFPQFAQFASAEWVADNIGAIRLLVAAWRATWEEF